LYVSDERKHVTDEQAPAVNGDKARRRIAALIAIVQTMMRETYSGAGRTNLKKGNQMISSKTTV